MVGGVIYFCQPDTFEKTLPSSVWPAHPTVLLENLLQPVVLTVVYSAVHFTVASHPFWVRIMNPLLHLLGHWLAVYSYH